MSTVASVSSISDLHQTANHGGLAKGLKGIGVIEAKIQSGNLSTAQSALSSFQRDVQGNPPFGMNTQANMDYQNLTLALQSEDLSAAQKAVASLQSDLKAGPATAKKTHVAHPHHGDATEPLLNSATPAATIPGKKTAPSSAPAPPDSTPEDSIAESDDIYEGSLLNVTA